MLMNIVLKFMTQAVNAKRQSQPTPSLLPHVPVTIATVKNAAQYIRSYTD